MKLYVLAFLVLLCFNSLNLIAQVENWQFDRISLKDGLSNTNVNEVMQDSKGYFWIATQNGLNRYNAYEFNVFNADPENEKSLNGDVVSSVFEDNENRIWVGTRFGLNEYDKKNRNFISYELEVSDNDDRQPYITDILQHDDNKILLATMNFGLLSFDKNSKTVEPIFPLEENENYIAPRFVRTLMIDSDDNLWVGTNGHGILRYDFKTKEIKSFHNTINDIFPVELSFCFDLHEDQKGDIWAGTFIGGLMKYVPEEDNFRLIKNPHNPEAQTKNGVMAISETSKGQLILGTNGGGVHVFETGSEKFIKHYLNEPSMSSSLSNDFIVSIYKDKEKNIWIGTENGGISVYNPNRRKFKSFKKTGTSINDLPGSTINAIYEDDNGILWIGTENNGFASLDRDSMTYKQFTVPNAQRDASNTFIKAIIGDGQGGIFVGANMGALSQFDREGNMLIQYSTSLQADNPKALWMDDIRCLTLDTKGVLWIGGYRAFSSKVGEDFELICEYPKESGLCFEAVSQIFEYDNDYLLVAYLSQGLRFHHKDKMKLGPHITIDSEEYPGLLSNSVNVVYRDSKDRLWLGTDKGLNYMKSDTSFGAYSSKDGLPSNQIFGILEDDEGNLWMSTALGLCCFNPDQETFKNYYEEDGLQSNVFRFGSYFKSESGEMFFGGVDGFNAFYPDQVKMNQKIPRVVFTDFQLFNKSVMPDDNSVLDAVIEETSKIELDYDQSIFSFEFAALNYTLTEQNEYAYQLIGFNEEKQYIGNRRYITFTNIPAGEYTLKVFASNNDGVWNNEGASIEIVIHPPFWQTWWFRILVGLSIIGIFYAWYRWRVNSIEAHSKKLEQQVKHRTKQVVEQKDEIELQKELVEQKNQDMMDSIRYSKRIQDSFLPNHSEFEDLFTDHFIVFKPKDIVSGDFYWMEALSKNSTDYVMLAVADCTGHGVPGAMVSVLGNNGLHRGVTEIQLTDSAKILDNLNDYVQKSFDKSDETVRDGMDIGLCTFNLKENKVNYAGANNPLWIIRQGELIEYKATKQPIGNYSKKIPFESNLIDLQAGDWVIMLTDGYPDQFGGEKGKKYKYKKLKDKLKEVCASKAGNEIEEAMNTEMKSWIEGHEQIDDICIVGIKV